LGATSSESTHNGFVGGYAHQILGGEAATEFPGKDLGIISAGLEHQFCTGIGLDGSLEFPV
jgi:hypothetical protein